MDHNEVAAVEYVVLMTKNLQDNQFNGLRRCVLDNKKHLIHLISIIYTLLVYE